MAGDYNLQVVVEAVDKASRVFNDISHNVDSFKSDLEGAGSAGKTSMESLGESLESVGDKMSSTGKTMTATVTTPIVALGTAAVKTAADFDTQMSKVKAISGATGKEFDELRAKAREMGAKTKFSAQEAGEAFEYMAMAGWKTGDMLDGIEGIMNLAAASGEKLGTTSDIVTDALTAFGMSAKDSGHFADLLAAASSNSNTNVSMMGETFKYAAPIAGAFGYSAEDTALAIGLMANSGIKASQAGTSLRTIMTRLTGDIQISGKALGDVTIATTKADGSMRDFNEIIMDCREAFSHLSESEKAATAESLVGKNAMSGFLAIMNAGEEDVIKLSEAITTCDGAAADMAETMNDNLEGQLTILKSQLQELAISFGEIIIPVLRSCVSVVQKVVEVFNSFSPATKKVITSVLAVAAAIGPVLLIGGKLVSGIGKLLTLSSKIGPAFTAIKTAAGVAAGGLKTLWAFMLANPITIVIAAVAALVAAFAYLWTHCEGFRKFWINLWDNIKAAASAAVDAIKRFLSSAWSVITTEATKAWDGIKSVISKAWDGIKSTVGTAMDAARTTVGTAWDKIRSSTSAAMDRIRANANSGWDRIKSVTSTAMERIQSVSRSAWDNVSSVASTAMNNIMSVMSSGMTGVLSVASNHLNALMNTFISVFNGVRNHVSNAVNWLKNIFNFSWSLPKIALPHFTISGSFSLNPPSVPTFGISWYKSAYDQAMVFQTPTVFGASGFGDGNGNEVVVGEDHLRDMIRDAVGGAGGGDMIFPIYIGQERIDEIVIRANQRQALLSGGR